MGQLGGVVLLVAFGDYLGGAVWSALVHGVSDGVGDIVGVALGEKGDGAGVFEERLGDNDFLHVYSTGGGAYVVDPPDTASDGSLSFDATGDTVGDGSFVRKAGVLQLRVSGGSFGGFICADSAFRVAVERSVGMQRLQEQRLYRCGKAIQRRWSILHE